MDSVGRALGFCQLHGTESDLSQVDGTCNSVPKGWEGSQARHSPASGRPAWEQSERRTTCLFPGCLACCPARPAWPNLAEDRSQWARPDRQVHGHRWTDRWDTRSVCCLTQQISVQPLPCVWPGDSHWALRNELDTDLTPALRSLPSGQAWG